MQIKSILAGAAIALLVGLGAASAAEQFATLDGISAETLSSAELASVKGVHVYVVVTYGGETVTYEYRGRHGTAYINLDTGDYKFVKADRNH